MSQETTTEQAGDFAIGPLSKTLQVSVQEQGGKPVATLRNASGRHFRLPLATFQLLQTIAAPSTALAFAAQHPEPRRAAVVGLLRQAVANGFLETEAEVAAAPPASRGNILLYRLFSFDPSRLLDMIGIVYRPLFTPAALALWVLALAFTVYRCVEEHALAWTQFVAFKEFHNWVLIYFLLILSGLMHELGHAYACRRHGGQVREIQIVLYFLRLGAFANVSSAWMLPRKAQRVEIALAGIYIESILAMLTLQVLIEVEPYSYASQAAFIFFVILATRMALNSIPTLRLDGYWVLSDLLGEPNLRQRSTAYVMARLPFMRSRRVNFKPNAAAIYWVFSLCSVAVIALFLKSSLTAMLQMMADWHPLLRLSALGMLLGMLFFSGLTYLRTIADKYLVMNDA